MRDYFPSKQASLGDSCENKENDELMAEACRQAARQASATLKQKVLAANNGNLAIAIATPYCACGTPSVFADVEITIRQRVAVLPVLGYWSELCSYWLTQNRRCL